MGSISPEKQPKVAFIGLGAMGFAMSTHLVRVGFNVTGFDVYGPTNERWSTACADIPNARYSVASSPADAVKNADIVLLMVANHYHVHSALFDKEKGGAVDSLPKGVIVVVMATIPPTQPSEVRRRLTEEFKREDVRLCDCPVSGGTARSVNGTLTIMASSDESKNLEDETFKSVIGNLANEGKTLYVIPGSLGGGESAKALNQVMCGIHIVAASEIMGLAALLKADTQKFFEHLTSSDPSWSSKKNVGWTWMFENRAPRMLSATPPMSSATSIIDKDVGIIRDEEKRLNVDLPLLNLASEQITRVMEKHASADDSIIAQFYLGMDSPRQNAVVEQNGKATESQQQLNKSIAYAAAIICLNSAYETIQFAKALDLMGPEQRKQWFSIIAGAAGGSTMFSEIVPKAFADTEGEDAAFKKFATERLGSEAGQSTENIIKEAKQQGYEPKLLEKAFAFFQQITA
ncbi:putative oxido [Cyphellophora attinorum]|uniref:Putative oxido n=1 Tax=Cyphellophora attinorum TaxID=1664694 RepID=A0A0N1HGC7_9EURO|nr:putative oxido [Phialophora attinorum]KPI44590.1 putative oxido [Phialophora attinorum]